MDRDRENLYRGKIKGNNTGHEDLDWAQGNFVEELGTGKCFIIDLSHFDENTKLQDVMIEVDPETVCQYTGLADKNGMKFEGDIFQADDDEYIQRYVIVWDNDALEWQAHNIAVNCGALSLSEFHSEDIQVIGNIFDNPELLEGGGS